MSTQDKTKPDTRPTPPQFEGQWYSVCSAHREYNHECSNCNAGRWISDAEQELSHWLWNYSQKIWRKWANRKPDTFLEKVFPNLHGTDKVSTCPTCSNSHSQLVEALKRSAKEHDDMAALLDAWARESVDGGWSTHQVDANRKRADQCRRLSADARAALKAAEEQK